jgi:hypothetical protein
VIEQLRCSAEKREAAQTKHPSDIQNNSVSITHPRPPNRFADDGSDFVNILDEPQQERAWRK